MRKFYLSIFWKFIIGIILIVGVFGSINILLIQQSVIKALQSESEKRGKYIAFNISNQALDPLLYEDYIALQKLVDNIQQIDSSVIYAFIEINHSSGKIIHNFQEDVPIELIEANKLSENTAFQIRLLTPKNKSSKIIRDIAVPVLNKDLGVVRIGILEDSINANANHTLTIFLFMVGIFLLLGILGAFIFSRLITRPIKNISLITENLDLDSLREEKEENIKLLTNQLPNKYFHIFDEMDYFKDKFYSMISRLKEAYKEIDLTYSKLIQSEKLASIGTLSAGIAHEINNPNTGIQYCIRILKKDITVNDKNLEYLVLMEEASEKIERVVKGLLEYSRPQIIDFDHINLNEIVEKSISLLRYRIDKLMIKFEDQFSNEEHIIYGSSHYLEQVIVNLLINSIDAIEEKRLNESEYKGKIFLEIVEKGSFTEIIVSDDGIGIKQENLKDVYDPFYTSKEVGKGTGLGLSVCMKIINLHHGTISLSSQYNIGTKFIISLPNKKENTYE